MSTVNCPYCHSEQVVFREPQPNGPQYFEKILDAFSPSAMAALGIKLAKEAGIPPYIGGLIGGVVGGALVMVSQHYFYRHYKSAQHYHCLQCGQDFAIAA